MMEDPISDAMTVNALQRHFSQRFTARRNVRCAEYRDKVAEILPIKVSRRHLLYAHRARQNDIAVGPSRFDEPACIRRSLHEWQFVFARFVQALKNKMSLG
jgi:hypothetical protein